MVELKDNYKRKIDYLRIGLTDRCNMRCRYCMPEKGMKLKKHSEILSYEEIIYFAKAAVKAGISRIRLTGGEPLIRKDVSRLISDICKLENVQDVSLTTNGVLLEKMSEELMQAGLKRINISLDSLNAKTYSYITRGGDLEIVLRGIKKAINIGLNPVKVNVVSLSSVLDELGQFVELTFNYPVHVRFIEYMNISKCSEVDYISGKILKKRLEQMYDLKSTNSPGGSGPAEYFNIKGSKGTIGFIFPYTKHFCPSCNRLRLTADGRLRTCLFSDREINVIKMLRKGIEEKELIWIIKEAMDKKPKDFHEASRDKNGRIMREIGG